jgi:hypothetical protein
VFLLSVIYIAVIRLATYWIKNTLKRKVKEEQGLEQKGFF